MSDAGRDGGRTAGPWQRVHPAASASGPWVVASAAASLIARTAAMHAISARSSWSSDHGNLETGLGQLEQAQPHGSRTRRSVAPQVRPAHVTLAQVRPATPGGVRPRGFPGQGIVGELQRLRGQVRPDGRGLGEGPGHPGRAVRQAAQGPRRVTRQSGVGPAAPPALDP